MSDFAVLNALASIREQMIGQTQRLRGHSAVTKAESRLEIRDYPEGGTHVETYIDAELEDGHALTWWLEARHANGRWAVEATIHQTGLNGQNVVRQLEARAAATSAAELAANLTSAANELLGAIDVFLERG
jgi:hypothetical protein